MLTPKSYATFGHARMGARRTLVVYNTAHCFFSKFILNSKKLEKFIKTKTTIKLFLPANRYFRPVNRHFFAGKPDLMSRLGI
jgi:hypothetical protein